jgi:hypothetical protein
MRRKLPHYLARVRMPLMLIAVLVMITWNWHGNGALGMAGLVIFALGMVSMYIPHSHLRRVPIKVLSPVRGRWVAVNSPADRVPSHGIDAYGQTYAIDLVHQPDTHMTWRALYGWPLARRPEEFPGFGRPVYALADGVVVRVRQSHRDHWSRNSWLGFLYLLLVESTIREVFGPGFIVGNHVVLDLGDGVYAAYAHLRRGSIQVRKGQRVTAGQRIAECGNSGNSSEPHLHVQLMDHPRFMVAAGLPFTFTYEIDHQDRHGLPHNKEPFTVPDRAPADA